ncbi:MAG: HAMP domain-containing histidine kinase [Cohaesibacter sp.]|jgi:two-component system OmpR family sensor kinase/two-component system sensor histidine kinase QseC|nr:HAMP domain-containing histidine kinase [Cohaesibacter sp.]
MTNPSIRRRLLTLLLPSIALLWLALTLFVYSQVRHEVIDANQSRLYQMVNAIAKMNGDEVNANWSKDYLEEDHFLAIQDVSGQTTMQSIPAFPLPANLAPGIHSIHYDDEDWLLWQVPGQNSKDRYIAGVQSEEATEVLMVMVASSSVPLAVMLIFITIISVYLVQVGLKPLTNLSRSLEQRSADNLSPLKTNGQPTELQPILTALNRLFSRISDYLKREHRFIDDAAHEIRTPLTVIKAQSQAIDRSKLDDETKSYFDNIVTGIDRTAKLATRLLEQAKATQPVSAELQAINLVPLMQQALASQALLADEKSITLSFDGPDKMVAKTDADDFASILDNLISNALHNTPDGGQIHLSVLDSDHPYKIDIEDSGPGIPLEQRDLVFERFSRLSPQQAQQGYNGTGLGLSITKALCERNQIGIAIRDSDRLGGACFELDFSAISRKES